MPQMTLQQITEEPLLLDLKFSDPNRKPLKIAIPMMNLGDLIKWGAHVDTQFEAKITKGLKPEAKFQLLTFYGPMPSNLFKLKSLAKTGSGINYILNTQLAKAIIVQEGDEPLGRSLTEKEIQEIKNFPPNALRDLADALCDVGQVDQAKEEPENSEEKEGQDPLTDTEGSESRT